MGQCMCGKTLNKKVEWAAQNDTRKASETNIRLDIAEYTRGISEQHELSYMRCYQNGDSVELGAGD